MKRVTLTCPFTGISFEATETADGDIIAYSPLTGEEIVMKFNTGIRHYYMRPGKWRHIETCSIKEMAEMLNITIQRAYTMTKTGVIAAHELPNGDKVVLRDDIERYNENRKCGRPRKRSEDAD